MPRDARGHFKVHARIEGRKVSFMVDTGASVIALTASDAARIGIHRAQHELVTESRPRMTPCAAPATLDKVEVGDLVVRDVAALLLPDEALSDSLLGFCRGCGVSSTAPASLCSSNNAPVLRLNRRRLAKVTCC